MEIGSCVGDFNPAAYLISYLQFPYTEHDLSLTSGLRGRMYTECRQAARPDPNTPLTPIPVNQRFLIPIILPETTDWVMRGLRGGNRDHKSPAIPVVSLRDVSHVRLQKKEKQGNSIIPGAIDNHPTVCQTKNSLPIRRPTGVVS